MKYTGMHARFLIIILSAPQIPIGDSLRLNMILYHNKILGVVCDVFVDRLSCWLGLPVSPFWIFRVTWLLLIAVLGLNWLIYRFSLDTLDQRLLCVYNMVAAVMDELRRPLLHRLLDNALWILSNGLILGMKPLIILIILIPLIFDFRDLKLANSPFLILVKLSFHLFIHSFLKFWYVKWLFHFRLLQPVLLCWPLFPTFSISVKQVLVF